MVVAIGLSEPALANPGLLWGLVKKATQGPVGSKEWSQVEDWLARDISESIDWNPAAEETVRVLMQRHNPDLYNRLFGATTDETEQEILVAPPARPFVGMAGYGDSQGELGIGFAGAVVKRVHKLSGVSVAVKTLRRAQYEQCGLLYPPIEAELMSRLWHPNIVRFYEAIMTEEAQFLIMELVSGSDLFIWSQKQGLIEESVCKPIIRQVLAALHCMHRAQICHRDLKPENLLIDDQGAVKVIDLGLACFFDPQGQLEEYCGSAEYAAPELLRKTPYVGPEVDIWALAVILYDLAIGDLPFQTPEETVALQYAVPEDVELSQPFRALIHGIFQEADKRASLEQIIKHKWVTEDKVD